MHQKALQCQSYWHEFLKEALKVRFYIWLFFLSLILAHILEHLILMTKMGLNPGPFNQDSAALLP